MKELSRKEIQQVSLEILKEIHLFCKENGINYSIGYGTLIGAVRHKGFIPWDDDIDIMMPRKDYERFSQTFKSDHYEFINYENCPDCWLLFGRVCDTTKTTERTICPWLGNGKDVGIWIDVFPIDETPDDLKEFQQYYGLLNHLYLQSVKVRRVHNDHLEGMPLKFKLKAFFRKHTNPRLEQKNPREFLEYTDMLIKGNMGRGCKHYAQMCCADDIKGHYAEEDINEFVELPFEDTKVMAFKGWHEILTKGFGNYMEIPPKKMRKQNTRKYLRFYWKEPTAK